MEKFLKQQEKERMRIAMLQQEEAFKKQVYELHRLYQVQKKLMGETKMVKKHWIPKDMDQVRAKEMFVLDPPAESCIKNSMAHMEQECEIELTLATGSRRGKREALSNSSASAASYSSSSIESGAFRLLGHEWGNPVVKKMYLAANGERNNGFEVEHRMKQDGIPWLLPCLSLTMS